MSGAGEDTARAALRARQGAGARHDAATAPARELGWARRGTAYFARLLNHLPDDGLTAPSRVPGWTRSHVVAHVGYNARALARLVECARTGGEMPAHESAEAQAAEVELGATLPARALRNLFQHAEVHLNVEWRDLSDDQWDAVVGGVPVRDTPWMRAREIWLHAVDLDTTGAYIDMPSDMVERLLPELDAAFGTGGGAVAPTDRSLRAGRGPEVHGTAAGLTRWIATSSPAGLSGKPSQPGGPGDTGQVTR